MKYFSIGAIILTVLVIVFGAFNFRSTSISLKRHYETQYQANKSSYDNMWKKFREMVQITDLQAEQLKDIYTNMITGRYQGNENLLFQAVSENNPQMADVYTSIQTQIAADRNSFNNEQKKVLDKAMQYNVYIEKHFIFNMIFNFEQIDTSTLIITSEKTERAFEDKKADEIDLLDR